jgi:hypothetical protein
VVFAVAPLVMFADSTGAARAMSSFLAPVMTTLAILASVAATFFLVMGGISYMTSSGNPEKLEHAKRVIRNALVGLVMVIGAGTLVAILSHAYSSSGSPIAAKLPALTSITPTQSNGLITTIIDGIIGVLATIVESVGQTFLDALKYFTTSTPLMADNSSVFNLWLVMVGITDSLFVLVVALLGFHVMSFAVFGLEETEFKHLLPRIGLAFLLVNTSLFVIDAVISLSNGMIGALNAAFPATSVWGSLTIVVSQANTLGLAGLMIMLAFIVLSVMLMVYYVLRLMTLYIGAVLSPIVMMLWLLPDFKYFAEAAARAYVSIIFVLFINVVILDLAASIFGGMTIATPDHSLNPLMAMVVGIAMLLALLKTQGVLTQLSYASLGPKTTSQLGGLILNVMSQHRGGRSRTGSRSAGSSGDDDLMSGGTRGGGNGRGHSGQKLSNPGYSSPTHPAPGTAVAVDEVPRFDPSPKPAREVPVGQRSKKGLAT